MAQLQDEKIWQETRAFEETNLHMLNNKVLCDVTFLVGTTKEEIRAHKFVLASHSPVFFAMFCGSMSETKNTIEIVDIESEMMNSLLRFIYTEDCEVSGESVTALLYAAKKYDIKRLEQKCREFLSKHISCDNVCSTFTQADMFSDLDLKKKCFDFILENGHAVILSDSFLTLSKGLLKEILESDNMRAEELDIYKCCKKWAIYQMRKSDENKEISPSDIRNTLGELLYLIRFPTMTIKKFSSEVSNDDILSPPEIVKLFQYLVDKSNNEDIKFRNKRRIAYKRKIFKRNQLEVSGTRWNQNGPLDAIDFVVSHKAMFYGIGIYSPCTKGAVKGTVSILRKDKSITNKEVEISYSSSKHHEEVLFDDEVYLEPNDIYTIKLQVVGQDAFRGSNGLATISEGNFCINFSHSNDSLNGTSVNQGQIPFLILGVHGD